MVVALIERDPRRGPFLSRSSCQPLRQQRRLAKAGRRGDEGQLALRAAADRFALDSGSKVGSIRQANQGVFSILPADQGSPTSEPGEMAGGDSGADSSLMKTVRIVTTVQYYLDK